MRLLESITANQLAACVPLIRITKIDSRSGKPAEDSRPLMFDLVQTPQFGAAGEDFGVDHDTFRERAMVSLQSMTVDSKLSYGLMLFREVTLNFVVHRPELVFDRASRIPWRELLEEGNSFSLEYGWSADPTFVPNDLFNGTGHVTERGVVIKSTQTVLLVVARYNLHLRQTGEVDVTVHALENGDIALRESRFSDVADSAFGPRFRFRTPVREDDSSNAQRLKLLLDGITPQASLGRGSMYPLGDVLDAVVAPMVDAAARAFGYSGASGPDTLLLANFNKRAGRQSEQYGGRDMSGRSIGDMLIPATRLREVLSAHFAAGRSMLLHNFVSILIGLVNAAEAWGADQLEGRSKPEVLMKADTVRNRDNSVTLVLTIYDRKVVTDVFTDSDRLPLGQQTRDNVMKVLRDKDVPVLEFATAGSLILDASFEMQPDALLQAIQVDSAYRDRKDRVQITAMPDVESRRGQAGAREIVPASILEGEVTMYGNFVVESFALVWVEFFRSASISGVFHVLEKTDTVEPGKFTSKLKLISEGVDPLNTRRRLTDGEIDATNERARRLRQAK
jgi:hypothetical protein